MAIHKVKRRLKV